MEIYYSAGNKQHTPDSDPFTPSNILVDQTNGRQSAITWFCIIKGPGAWLLKSFHRSCCFSFLFSTCHLTFYSGFYNNKYPCPFS
jgi:hypothetical protein